MMSVPGIRAAGLDGDDRGAEQHVADRDPHRDAAPAPQEVLVEQVVAAGADEDEGPQPPAEQHRPGHRHQGDAEVADPDHPLPAVVGPVRGVRRVVGEQPSSPAPGGLHRAILAISERGRRITHRGSRSRTRAAGGPRPTLAAAPTHGGDPGDRPRAPLRPHLRGVRGRRRLPPLAREDHHGVRRPPLLHDHHEPPPAPHQRVVRGAGPPGPQRGGGQPRLLAGAGHERPRRVGPGGGQPGGRGAQALQAHVPRRHHPRRDPGPRQEAHVEGGPGHRLGRDQGHQPARRGGLLLPPQGDGLDRRRRSRAAPGPTTSTPSGPTRADRGGS